MNIAICDDEQVFLRQLHRKIADLKIPDCQIHEFSSGKELLSSFIKGMNVSSDSEPTNSATGTCLSNSD